MYIAMNRFKIAKGREADFEAIWKTRRSRLSEMKGFVEFRLLRGPEAENHTLYASHTMWESYDDFKVWTQSEQFREAHKNSGKANTGPSTILEHPQFEGFQTVITEPRAEATAEAAA